MDNLAREKKGRQATQEWATVTDAEPGGFSVKTETGVVKLKRAASCLVDPEIGDLVLVSISDLGHGYVLAVLEKEPGAKTKIRFEADVDLSAPAGKVGINSKDGIDLASAKDVNVLATEVSVNAGKAEANLKETYVRSGSVETSFGTVRVLADAIDTIVANFTQRAKQSLRVVEGLDHVRTGFMNYVAKKSMTLRGEEFSQLTSKKDVHIDGERINIG